MLIITSKKDGFRRCGIAHPARPAEYPDTAFTGVELAQLRAEPMLVINHVVDAHQMETPESEMSTIVDKSVGDEMLPVGDKTTAIAVGKKAEKKGK